MKLIWSDHTSVQIKIDGRQVIFKCCQNRWYASDCLKKIGGCLGGFMFMYNGLFQHHGLSIGS